MTKTILRWTRCRDGYEAVTRDRGSYVVKPRSRDNEEYEPLAESSALFKEFAELEGDEKSFVRFADRFGLLKHRTEPEEIVTFRSESANINFAVMFFEKHDTTSFESIINSWPSPSAKLRVHNRVPIFEADSLLSAMWIQLILAFSYDQVLEQCELCSSWFTVGHRSGRARRREGPVFCSPRCQKAHAYQRRRVAAAQEGH